MNIIYEQNGGSDRYYVEDDSNSEKNLIPVIHNTRSFFIGIIDQEKYNKISENISNLRKNGLKVQLYQPEEHLEFKRELITTDDYNYQNKFVCCSSCFTDDIIEEYSPNIKTYRIVAIDLIWCRESMLNVI